MNSANWSTLSVKKKCRMIDATDGKWPLVFQTRMLTGSDFCRFHCYQLNDFMLEMVAFDGESDVIFRPEF